MSDDAAGPDVFLAPDDPTADPPASGASQNTRDDADSDHGGFDLDALRRRAAGAAPDPMAAPPLRWGVLGPGRIAGRFTREIPEFSQGRVVAVGSRDAGRAREFAEQYPGAGGEPGSERAVPRAHGSYEDLVADEGVDAVYIASPHSHHRDHALLALAAGKHVLVEKAFTRSAAEAREVFDAARERGRFAMEAMWARFLPYQRALDEVVRSGVLGEIISVHADHSQRLTHLRRAMEPELAGGVLLDMNIYSLALIHLVLGAPSAVTAHGVRTETGVDGHEVLVLDYRPDRPRTLAVASSTLWGRSRTEASVVGSLARADVRGRFYRPAATIVVSDDRDRVLLRFPDGPEQVARASQGGFQHEAAEVARCVAAGRLESEVMPWSATLEILELCDEVRRQLSVVYPGE